MSTTTESTMVADTPLQLETDDQSTSWLAQVFQPFLMPIDADSGESQGDRYDWRFLGVSNLKSSKYDMSEVSFFQVFVDSMEKQSGSLLAETWARNSLTSSPSTTSGLSTMTDESDVSKMAPQLYQRSETNGYHNHPAPVGHTIVMSLNTQVFKPSKRQLYYIFPCDAIVETVNETPPYELFCSFHSLDFFPEQKLDSKISNTASVATTKISSLDNQQGYTDIPSSPLLLTVASGIKAEQISIPSIVHLSLSGISQELYLIIKESVAGFETAYGRMIQLMKLHTEGVSNRHAELLVVNGNNGTRSKKPTIETKTGKAKRKGSYQHRQTSPRTATATAITPTTSNLSNKAKPTISANDIDSNATSPKQPILSPPMPSHVATPSNSAPIIPSGTSTSPTNASHRHNSANGNGRKCHYCGSKSTPMWRRGPEGAGTLCNACGVKWKHGKILCGKQSGSSPAEAALGSTSSPTPTSTKSANGYISKSLATKEQKKRKQHVELKIKKDKRIKIKEQQQQQQQRLRQQNSHSWHGNGTTLDSMMETDDEDDDEDDDDDDDDDQNDIGSSGFSDDDDFMGEYDEDDDERMNHNIVAARHLTIHESQQHHHHPYHNALSTGSTPPQPQSRSRSMTTSAANEYMTFQQQQQQQQQEYQQQQQLYQQNGWSMANGFHHNQQHQTYYYQQQREEQQHRPRRHTADISVLDQVPWGEFPLSMGVDAVEAATVLTLLKRS